MPIIVSSIYGGGILAASTTLYGISHRLLAQETRFDAPLHFDYTKTEPRATVLFGTHAMMQTSVWDPDGGAPLQDQPNPIPIWMPFDMRLELGLAESRSNVHAGVFTVRLELVGVNGTVIETVARPCFTRYRNRLHRWIRYIVFAVPMLLGLGEESQAHTMPMLTNYKQAEPFTSARVVLSRSIQLYSASLTLQIRQSRTRSVIYALWAPTAFVGIGFIAILLVICSYPLLRLLFLLRYAPQTEEKRRFRGLVPAKHRNRELLPTPSRSYSARRAA